MRHPRSRHGARAAIVAAASAASMIAALYLIDAPAPAAAPAHAKAPRRVVAEMRVAIAAQEFLGDVADRELVGPRPDVRHAEAQTVEANRGRERDQQRERWWDATSDVPGMRLHAGRQCTATSDRRG